jgi:hypothetical protein
MPCLLILAATLAAASPEPVILGRLERPALAVAHVGSDRALLLEEDRLTLWHLSGSGMTLEATLLTQTPVERVRHPGGLIQAPEGEGAAWVHRSGWTQAILVSSDNGTLTRDSAADVLPWPGAPNGVRFRVGTSLIEARLDGVADGPYVALSPDGRAAADAEGRLLLARPEPASPSTAAVAVGSALAHPWPDVVVASSAAADAPDALLIVRIGGPPRVLSRVPLNGRIQALAVRREGGIGIVLAAIEDALGHALVRVDIRRPGPTP